MPTSTRIDLSVVVLVDGDIPVEESAELVEEARIAIRSFFKAHRRNVIAAEGLAELYTIEMPGGP